MAEPITIIAVVERDGEFGLAMPRVTDWYLERYAAMLLYIIEELAERFDESEEDIILYIHALSRKPGRPKLKSPMEADSRG